ncbi:hypothetical protein BDP55DRAFT_742452 [Colletotrichum godetiae]|uniref:Secreted protein n=1 Tax=Colletotrichum godetiae TaxID=1209918 RepID=A0AAJ0AN78_9PEZI|nr:uncharacterized protein BDP55DRAFT_742452 [Colletotrichum godetiae]KAK1676355.1 hypothetical protein BDP55DRAFT_742452 [Colletotrichum godetiae]
MVTFRLMGLAVAEFAWSAADDDDRGGSDETNRKCPAQSGPISSAASAQICKGHQKRPSNPAPGNVKLARLASSNVVYTRQSERASRLAPGGRTGYVPPQNPDQTPECVCGSWGDTRRTAYRLLAFRQLTSRWTTTPGTMGNCPVVWALETGEP